MIDLAFLIHYHNLNFDPFSRTTFKKKTIDFSTSNKKTVQPLLPPSSIINFTYLNRVEEERKTMGEGKKAKNRGVEMRTFSEWEREREIDWKERKVKEKKK